MNDLDKESEYVLRMVGGLKLGEGCLIKIDHQSLIGYYIWQLTKSYPFSQFEISTLRVGEYTFDLNIFWIGVKE